MAELLTCRRGVVAVLEGCKGLPAKLMLEGFKPVASIIESLQVDQAVNIQFMTSLKDAVYAYVFGDQMGSITIQGLAFAGVCQGSNSGLKDAFDYYKDFRAAKRQEVITITFGPESFSGFLTRMRMQPRDPLAVTVGFELTFNTLPKKGGG